MSSLPARMKKIQLEMKALEYPQDFSHYKSMGNFRYGQVQVTPQSLIESVWLKFELVRDVMVVLLTCKNKEDRINNKGARVFTTLHIDFLDAQGQITVESVVVSGRNWNSSKLLCMSLLPTRMKLIHTKMKELEWSQDFSHYKSTGIFQNAQGQITPQSLVKSGPNSNLSEILWLSSLTASIKKIRSKMKALACSQHFPHYNLMGAFRCHGHKSSDPIWSKTLCILYLYPMMLQIKFGYN